MMSKKAASMVDAIRTLEIAIDDLTNLQSRLEQQRAKLDGNIATIAGDIGRKRKQLADYRYLIAQEALKTFPLLRTRGSSDAIATQRHRSTTSVFATNKST